MVGELPPGAFVEATLLGPSFPARRLVAAPNQPLMLPPLNLVGDYSLDGIRLIDPATGAVLLEGSPSTVPVRVFDEVLVSRVTSGRFAIQEGSNFVTLRFGTHGRISGSLTVGADARLELALAARHPDHAHRRLAVGTTANVLGALAVALLPGFDESEDADFDILTANAITFDPEAVEGLVDNQGYTFEIIPLANALNLRVLAIGEIPSGTAVPTSLDPLPDLRLETQADGTLRLNFDYFGESAGMIPMSGLPTHLNFEYSTDLRTWRPLDEILLESGSGWLRVQPPKDEPAMFFRVRGTVFR